MKNVIFFLVIILNIFFAQLAIAEENKAMKVMEYFQAFCWEPDAEFIRIQKLAKVANLIQLPNALSNAVAGSESTETISFFIKKVKNKNIILGISQPDTCVITYQGVDSDKIKEILNDYYKINTVATDDIGMQVTEMYIPNGLTASKEEATQKGLIMFTYAKPSTNYKAGTVSWMPPRTAKNAFH